MQAIVADPFSLLSDRPGGWPNYGVTGGGSLQYQGSTGLSRGLHPAAESVLVPVVDVIMTGVKIVIVTCRKRVYMIRRFISNFQAIH